MKEKWNCKKGHELKPYPNIKGGYYCPICEPKIHEYVSAYWEARNKKRKQTMRNKRTINVLNQIYDKEIYGE